MRTLLTVDFLNLAFRAIHGYPPLTSPEGAPVGGAFGVLAMTQSLIALCRPTVVTFAFESTTGSARTDLFPGYKEGRPEIDDSVREQIILANRAVGAMGWARYRAERYEADDALMVLARLAREAGFEHTYIATGDRDLMGAVNEQTTLLWTAQGMGKLSDREHTNWMTPAKVEARYGVPPERFVDRKALAGDASDTIPGVPGIGEVKAIRLLDRFGTFENLYDAVYMAAPDGEATPAAAAQLGMGTGDLRKLLAGEALGRMSLDLGRLHPEVELTPFFDPQAGRLGFDDRLATLAFLRRYGMASIEKRLPRQV